MKVANLKNGKAYADLGEYFERLGKFDKAEEIYKKAIETYPNNDEAFVDLGNYYIDSRRKPNKAEEMFNKAITINPENDEAFARLGLLYGIGQKFYKAEEMFNKAIEIDPENVEAYVGLGIHYYRYIRNFVKAEEMFNKAIAIDPENDEAYIGLGIYYISQGELDKAEEMLKKPMEKIREQKRLYSILAILYKLQGKNESSEEYFRKANNLRTEYVHSATRHNYQRIKKIITKKGIKLVYIQYPMRNIKPLKKLFKNDENTVFVDNEKVFKESVLQEGYNEYFTDMYGGDFGHKTKKGNQLLATNIANTIIKEFFDSPAK